MIKHGALVLAAATWWAVSLTPSPVFAQIPPLEPDGGFSTFRAMAEYLSRGSGRWRAPNPNHDPNRPGSPAHFGLWFDWLLNGQILQLQIVVYRGDSAVVSSRGRWVWHPGEGYLSYETVSRNGRFAEGRTTFLPPHTFMTVTTTYTRAGAASTHRDENILLSDTVHRNTSYRRAADGSWVNEGVYEWERLPEPAGARR